MIRQNNMDTTCSEFTIRSITYIGSLCIMEGNSRQRGETPPGTINELVADPDPKYSLTWIQIRNIA